MLHLLKYKMLKMSEAETILRDTKDCLEHLIERDMLNLSDSSAQEICDDIDKYFDEDNTLTILRES